MGMLRKHIPFLIFFLVILMSYSPGKVVNSRCERCGIITIELTIIAGKRICCRCLREIERGD